MVQGIHESFDQEFNMSSENKVHTDLKPDTKSEPKHEIGKMFANPEQEIHKFSCKICLKSYLSQKAMNQHLNVHKEKKYFCRFCQKAFHYQQVLHHHEMIHTGEQPYGCSFGELKFNQQTSKNSS